MISRVFEQPACNDPYLNDLTNQTGSRHGSLILASGDIPENIGHRKRLTG
jgi:hypothetical protein